MFRRILLVLGAVVLAGCAPAAGADVRAQIETAPRSEELMGRLVGRWVLTGEIAGQSTVHDVEAEWVLQRKYVRISEVSRERDEDGRPQYEATIFVGWLNDHYVCVWLDNTEVASGEVTCVAPDTADAIPFEFRDADGTLIFTNTFSYNRADDTWQWRMVNVGEAGASEFGTVSLRRR